MESLPEEEKQIEQPPAEGEAQEVKVEPGKELDLRRLKQLMKDTTDQFEKNELQIKQLTDTYFEWLKLFNHFGSAVAIAFSGKYNFSFCFLTVFFLFPDIDGKAKAMNFNQDLFVNQLKTLAPDSAEGQFIHAFVQHEKALNIQNLNVDDNKKNIKKNFPNKADQQPWMTKYESTSRTLFRGCWFFDFLREIFVGITQRRDEMMGKIGKHAYSVGLAPHHGYILKKTAGLAFNAIKRKDKFFKGITDE